MCSSSVQCVSSMVKIQCKDELAQLVLSALVMVVFCVTEFSVFLLRGDAHTVVPLVRLMSSSSKEELS